VVGVHFPAAEGPSALPSGAREFEDGATEGMPAADLSVARLQITPVFVISIPR
jgi:hypothetical protein